MITHWISFFQLLLLFHWKIIISNPLILIHSYFSHPRPFSGRDCFAESSTAPLRLFQPPFENSASPSLLMGSYGTIEPLYILMHSLPPLTPTSSSCTVGPSSGSQGHCDDYTYWWSLWMKFSYGLPHKVIKALYQSHFTINIHQGPIKPHICWDML